MKVPDSFPNHKPFMSLRDLTSMLWLTLLVLTFSGCATMSAYAADGSTLRVPHVVLDTGHTATINQIVQDPRTGYVFSASNDGTVRIWNPNSDKLQSTLRISHLPVVAVAVNPTSSELTAVVSDGGVYFELSSWNWITGQKIFSHSLSEVPLMLSYSPKGSFVLYATTQWKSLVFLDSHNGHELNYLPNGFGIVPFAIISGSEQTLMTYAPSTGDLVYWDLSSGTRKATIPSVPNMNNVTKISDVYIAGVTGDTLTVVNIVTGDVAYQQQLGSVLIVRSNQQTGQIAVLYTPPAGSSSGMTSSDGQSSAGSSSDGTSLTGASSSGSSTAGDKIALFTVNNGNVSSDYFAADQVPTDITAMRLMDGKILFAQQDGSMSTISQYSSAPQRFSENIIQPVTDIAFSDDRFFAVTNTGLISVRSDFFSKARPEPSQVTRIAEVGASNPFDATSGLLSLPNGQLYLFRGSDKNGELKLLNPNTLGLTDTLTTFSAPLVSMRPAGTRILALQRNGNLRLLNSSTYNTEFSFTSSGTLSSVFTDNYGIIVGKNNTNNLDSSLIRVSPSTGETVGITSDSFLSFGLAFDTAHQTLYSLGLRHSNGSEVTVLEAHTGTDFGQTQTIATYPGEDIQATLAYDSQDNRVYSTLGFDSVHVWDGRNLTTLAPSGHIPRKVVSWNGRVYSVNRDGSVSVWDSGNQRHLFDFYVLPDGSWVILTPDGRYLPSSMGNPEQYLSVVRPTRSIGNGSNNTTSELQSFRLRIQGTESTINQPGAFVAPSTNLFGNGTSQ